MSNYSSKQSARLALHLTNNRNLLIAVLSLFRRETVPVTHSGTDLLPGVAQVSPQHNSFNFCAGAQYKLLTTMPDVSPAGESHLTRHRDYEVPDATHRTGRKKMELRKLPQGIESRVTANSESLK